MQNGFLPEACGIHVHVCTLLLQPVSVSVPVGSLSLELRDGLVCLHFVKPKDIVMIVLFKYVKWWPRPFSWVDGRSKVPVHVHVGQGPGVNYYSLFTGVHVM